MDTWWYIISIRYYKWKRTWNKFDIYLCSCPQTTYIYLCFPIYVPCENHGVYAKGLPKTLRILDIPMSFLTAVAGTVGPCGTWPFGPHWDRNPGRSWLGGPCPCQAEKMWDIYIYIYPYTYIYIYPYIHTYIYIYIHIYPYIYVYMGISDNWVYPKMAIVNWEHVDKAEDLGVAIFSQSHTEVS